RKRVDELAYGLGDLVCPFLVEKPHDTNSPHSAASARRAAPLAGRKLASEVRPRQPRQVCKLTAVTFLQNDARVQNHRYPAKGLTIRSAPLRERFRDFATRSMASATSESRTCA